MTERGIIRLFKNLQAGGKLVCFRSVDRFNFRFSLNQIALLLTTAFLVTILAGYVTTDAPRVFSFRGFFLIPIHVTAFLIGAYLVTAIQRTPTGFSAFAVVVLSVALIFQFVYIAAGQLLNLLPDDQSASIGSGTDWVILGWGLLIVFRAIRITCTPRVIHGFVLAIVYTAIIFAPTRFLPAPEFWRTAQSTANTEPRRATPNVEQTYYAQPRLMRRHLKALAENRPNVTDLYFLGFAGASYQDVFMREVKSVTRLFDDRFDTQDRSLGLINNMATLKTHPLANFHNLNWALQGMAAKMDLEQDVLFLFLTSHGSRNATLETRFWPLRHNTLSANRLSDALNRSGIKWRVIVVSACYSGSFIEALQNDHTLVITASRQDRNSFGCSNEADYTYFGRAYFDEALRARTSFIEAFEIARKTVDEREREEDFKPSEPQMVVGRHIEAKLRELEQRLENSEVSIAK